MDSRFPLQAGRWESVDHFVAVSGGAYLGFSEWVGVQVWRMLGQFDRFPMISQFSRKTDHMLCRGYNM